MKQSITRLITAISIATTSIVITPATILFAKETNSGLFMQESVVERTLSPFSLPVTKDQNSYRKFDSTAVKGNFHTGDDYYNKDLKALSSNCGVVEDKILNGKGDHGLGNTLIIKHTLENGTAIYSLYGHLASFSQGTDKGKTILKGQQIGTIGKTGTSNGAGDLVHLHYELKVSPILGNPSKFGSTNKDTKYGYVPITNRPNNAISATNYGFLKPTSFSGKAICN